MNVYDEIRAERDWSNDADDDTHDPRCWTYYLAKESSRWQRDGQIPPFTSNDVDAFRRAMIKTAAIAVAAVESLDRQRKRRSQAFYEESVLDVLG